MNEHFWEEEFIPYLDGRLRDAERARLDSHLAACAACRERVDELRAVAGVLDDWSAAEPSPGFDAVLRSRLAQESEPGMRWAWLRPVYAGALAVAVLVLVATVLERTTPVEAPTLPQVAQQPMPAAPPEATRPSQTLSRPPPAAPDTLAVLDNPAVLENYELLEQFDVLFEPAAREGKKL